MNKIVWSKLGFGYVPTDYNIRCRYKNGQWGELEISSEENIPIHMAASCLHYGQEIFEGMKAFEGKDGKIRVFRIDQNSKRMQDSAEFLYMPKFPVEKFEEAIKKVVKLNKKYVPPYGTGASLYIRPLMIGVGPDVGVSPSDEYLFVLFTTPVGSYFKGGFKLSNVIILRNFDRAAPYGTGHIKCGGNYAASLQSGELAHKKGYSMVCYLDAKEKKYIDECGAANFFMIKGNKYITPKSHSILPSITNKSLRQLAKDMGMEVEQRPVGVDELPTFDEIGACGTAAVISPIGVIDDGDTGAHYDFSKNGEAGPISRKLYERLKGIQLGDVEDVHNWVTIL